MTGQLGTIVLEFTPMALSNSIILGAITPVLSTDTESCIYHILVKFYFSHPSLFLISADTISVHFEPPDSCIFIRVEQVAATFEDHKSLHSSVYHKIHDTIWDEKNLACLWIL